eukprot:g1117.t1
MSNSGLILALTILYMIFLEGKADVYTFPVKSIDLSKALSVQLYAAIPSDSISGIEDLHPVHGIQLTDGTYLVCGKGIVNSNSMSFVMRVSKTGKYLWGWKSDVTGTDACNAVLQLNNDEVLAVGYQTVGTNGHRYIVKLKLTDGSLLWTAKSFGDGAGSTGAYEMISKSSDAVYLSGLMEKPDLDEMSFKSYGNTEGGKAFVQKILLSKLAGTSAPTASDVAWTKTFASYSTAHAVRYFDSKLAVLLWNPDKQAGALVLNSATGDTVWGPLDYHTHQGEGTDIQVTPSKASIAIIGHGAVTTGSLSAKLTSIKAADGVREWTKAYSSGGNPKLIKNECWGLLALSDGFVAACGTGIENCNNLSGQDKTDCDNGDGDKRAGAYKRSAGVWQALTIRTDSSGKLLWQRVDQFKPKDAPALGETGWEALSSAAEFVSPTANGFYFNTNDEVSGVGIQQFYNNASSTPAPTPKTLRTGIALAITEMTHDNFEKAAKVLEKSLQRSKKKFNSEFGSYYQCENLHLQGIAQKANGDVEKAMRLFGEAIKCSESLNSTDGEKVDEINLLHDYASLQLENSYYKEALVTVKRACRKRKDFKCLNFLGIAYSKLNQRKKAEMFFRKALKKKAVSSSSINAHYGNSRSARKARPQVAKVLMQMMSNGEQSILLSSGRKATMYCADPPIWVIDNVIERERCESMVDKIDDILKNYGEKKTIKTCFSATRYFEFMQNKTASNHVTKKNFAIEKSQQSGEIRYCTDRNFRHANQYYSDSIYIETGKLTLLDSIVRDMEAIIGSKLNAFNVNSQLLHYAANNESSYSLHTDCGGGISQPFDRVLTALLYLTDVTRGGNTSFPNVGCHPKHLEISPKRGRLVLFQSFSKAGFCNQKSLHEAKPLLPGSTPKYAIQRFYLSNKISGSTLRSPDASFILCDQSKSCQAREATKRSKEISSSESKREYIEVHSKLFHLPTSKNKLYDLVLSTRAENKDLHAKYSQLKKDHDHLQSKYERLKKSHILAETELRRVHELNRDLQELKKEMRQEKASLEKSHEQHLKEINEQHEQQNKQVAQEHKEEITKLMEEIANLEDKIATERDEKCEAKLALLEAYVE